MNLTVEVSVGEVIDKITILEIKARQITCPEKVANVQTELRALQARFECEVETSAELERLVDELRVVNGQLWDIEDAIREKERQSEFDDEFIEIARSVYRRNDVRADLKRKINVLTGSAIVEEKSYAGY